jgi:hypothetical protein
VILRAVLAGPHRDLAAAVVLDWETLLDVHPHCPAAPAAGIVPVVPAFPVVAGTVRHCRTAQVVVTGTDLVVPAAGIVPVVPAFRVVAGTVRHCRTAQVVVTGTDLVVPAAGIVPVAPVFRVTAPAVLVAATVPIGWSVPADLVVLTGRLSAAIESILVITISRSVTTTEPVGATVAGAPVGDMAGGRVGATAVVTGIGPTTGMITM